MKQAAFLPFDILGHAPAQIRENLRRRLFERALKRRGERRREMFDQLACHMRL